MKQRFDGGDGHRSTLTTVAKAVRHSVALMGATLLASCGGGSGVASAPAAVALVPTGSSTPTQAPAATPTPTATQFATSTIPTSPRFELGINVGGSVYYGSERTFANLAKAAGGWRDPEAGWGDLAAAKKSAAGYPTSNGVLPLNVPQPVWSGADTPIRCTWAGSGTLRVDGDRMGESYGDHTLSVTWKGRATPTALPQMLLYVSGVNAADPLRDLDCREPTLVANGVFDQRLVDDLKPYGVLRFLDWSSANGNPQAVTWGARTGPDQLVQDGVDGIAIEHMVDLANAAGSDAWFTVPWNADETYVRNMAKLVHDRLAAGHRAYFELSNETWNYGFGQATQVLNEGIAENLSSDKYSNNLLRYAEKSTWFHKLLTEAFKDDPKRLVRVVNTMNDNTWSIDQVMGFKDTAQYVDAIATAPYFGADLFTGANATSTDVPALFTALEGLRVHAIDLAVANKAIAAKYGKRYIAYEGGQHILPPAASAAAVATMQRSPLMYEMYKRYLTDWKARIGDTMTLYSATGTISQYGSWGIREYAGQPLADTPKRRAALEFAR